MLNNIIKILLKLKYGDSISIGNNVKFESWPKLTITDSKIRISDGVILRKGIELRAIGNSKIILCENSVIDNGCRLIAANGNTIKIGKGGKIGFYSVLNGGGGITIGENTSLYGFVYVQTSTHLHKGESKNKSKKKYSHDNVKIGDNCLIGAHSSLLPGAKIPSNSTISFNSIIK